MLRLSERRLRPRRDSRCRSFEHLADRHVEHRSKGDRHAAIPKYRLPVGLANDKLSAISNVLTGRPARVLVNRIVREVGPLATGVPSFPLGALALEPLRKKAESEGSADFTGLTAGEAAALCRELPAGELTLKLAAETLQRLGALGRAR